MRAFIAVTCVTSIVTILANYKPIEIDRSEIISQNIEIPKAKAPRPQIVSEAPAPHTSIANDRIPIVPREEIGRGLEPLVRNLQLNSKQTALLKARMDERDRSLKYFSKTGRAPRVKQGAAPLIFDPDDERLLLGIVSDEQLEVYRENRARRRSSNINYKVQDTVDRLSLPESLDQLTVTSLTSAIVEVTALDFQRRATRMKELGSLGSKLTLLHFISELEKLREQYYTDLNSALEEHLPPDLAAKSKRLVEAGL